MMESVSTWLLSLVLQVKQLEPRHPLVSSAAPPSVFRVKHELIPTLKLQKLLERALFMLSKLLQVIRVNFLDLTSSLSCIRVLIGLGYTPFIPRGAHASILYVILREKWLRDVTAEHANR